MIQIGKVTALKNKAAPYICPTLYLIPSEFLLETTAAMASAPPVAHARRVTAD